MSNEKVFYPNGKEARVGDIVWSHDGTHARKIIEVVPKSRAPWFGEDEGGILVARHIGPFDVGGLFFITQNYFEEESIYPVDEVDMREIERLYKLLGSTLHIEIWGNPDFAYYPVLNIETIDGEDVDFWYLYFQPAKDVKLTSDTEVCYLYHKKIDKFIEVPRSQQCQMRGMLEVGGGGCES